MATFKKTGKKGQEKWSVVFDAHENGATRKQKRLSGFKTRQEANLAYISYVANHSTIKDTDSKECLALVSNGRKGEMFTVAYSKYLNSLEIRVKESSYTSIESSFKKHVCPQFENLSLLEIDTPTINNFYTHLIKIGLSYETRNKISRFLSQFFNFCVSENLIYSNPCHKATRIRNQDIKREISVWTEQEFLKFIACIDKLEYKVFFSFLYLTGCRRGEALALTWFDINGDVVKIRKTLGYHTKNGGYAITSPKNRYSNRDIIMPKNLISLLNELKTYYQSFELFHETNFVFGNIKPLAPENIRRWKSVYCKQAGVGEIRIHDLRHSHVSLLISKGHDIVTIAHRLGHADIEMTLNTYAHLMPNKQTELMSSLNLEI